MTEQTALDPAVVADWCERSRATSGLPAKITDGEVLSKIVTLALAGTDQQTTRRRPDRARAG
jgi:hypothetical protein